MSTFVIIFPVDVPIACAASIMPLSTSLIDDSTIRATYGAAAIISTTTIALLPKLVPTTSFATGRSATISMINGILLKIFTINPTIRLSHKTGQIPSLSVTESIIPSGSPITYETIVDKSVI